MRALVCLLVTLAVVYGASTPSKPNCLNTFCTMDLKICPDGTPAPVPVGGCCPSLSACKTAIKPIKPISNCAFVMCTMDLKVCPDGTPAPVPVGGCCPSLSACKTTGVASRNLLGSLGQNANLLSSITHLLPQGTSITSILSILNLLNNINHLSNDIHQIPALVNQTLSTLVGGAGQATQIIIDQLVGLVTPHGTASRNLLGSLGQNANLLSSITHLLPQGTSIASILSILNLLNNINHLSNDIHQIPVLLNQTLATLVGGAGQATQIIVDQLVGLVTPHATASRDLLGALGQNGNLLSSISHLLPQGTSISTVLSLLNLLNNVNALNNDLHQIPAVLQETLQSILSGIQNGKPSA